MPVRRSADPIVVQHVWDAIHSAHAQRQMAETTRIAKYLQKVDKCTQAQAEYYLKQCINDGLVMTINKVFAKGLNIGKPVESYKIPFAELPNPVDDGKDWYCIECHLAGDVTPCRLCYRVYHAECANKKQQVFNKSTASYFKRLSNFSSRANSPIKETNNTQENDNSNSTVNCNDLEKEKLLDNTNDSAINVISDTENENTEKDLEKNVEPFVTNSISVGDVQNSENSSSDAFDKCNDISSSKSDSSNNLKEEDDKGYDETLCSICNIAKLETGGRIEQDELNYLLIFVHNRIKSWLPSNLTDTLSQAPKAEWMTESEIAWRMKQLFYQPMDMLTMESKLLHKKYTKLWEFTADVVTVQHNVAIFHGIESQEFGAAEYMMEDCRYDISELTNCSDCYKHSNEKINSKWFCLPCRVPHELVWAKQKGYPYWPAKVLKESGDNCDVRFFGGKYERSVLSKLCIKPISTKMDNLQVKKNAPFHKAMEELLLHQQMLKNPSEIQKFLNRKSKLSPPKTSTVVVPKSSKKVVSKNAKKRTKSLESTDYNFTNFESNKSNPKRRRHTSPVARTEPSLRQSMPNRSAKNKVFSSPVDQPDYSLKDGNFNFGRRCDDSNEEVSSSTEHLKSSQEVFSRDNSDGLMPEPDRQYSESVEKTRRKLEQCRDKKQLIKVALECMQGEIDAINSEHDEYLKKIFEAHNAQISETKKKQWCYNCEQDAIYHCCWNTAYCSPICQQQHWQAEHKKVCRRKR